MASSQSCSSSAFPVWCHVRVFSRIMMRIVIQFISVLHLRFLRNYKLCHLNVFIHYFKFIHLFRALFSYYYCIVHADHACLLNHDPNIEISTASKWVKSIHSLFTGAQLKQNQLAGMIRPIMWLQSDVITVPSELTWQLICHHTRHIWKELM